MVERMLYALNFEITIKQKYPLLMPYYDDMEMRFCFPKSALEDDGTGTVSQELIPQIFSFMEEYGWVMSSVSNGETYFYLSEEGNIK